MLNYLGSGTEKLREELAEWKEKAELVSKDRDDMMSKARLRDICMRKIQAGMQKVEVPLSPLQSTSLVLHSRPE